MVNVQSMTDGNVISKTAVSMYVTLPAMGTQSYK